ncbi:hypothetical protein [Limnoglobus roseus]|uniref:Uncharacterized protein n=1 Tax=Limnoglobus roseus TaxID=2598579 RepID=A0A5C1AC32_9BACT|nr:hypothetical protein [Limnoglobus roseus]QEL16280.1 hypothetical protein PX52LOC_03221 [Limnoglobus roseus]
MAYNPFDFFRRNQKTAFAALTIFVMFTFVLSFGQGDFFQWFGGWLGSNFRSRGKDVMATIDGRKVYDTDLMKHDDDRALADQFMRSMLDQVSRDADVNIRENLKSATKSTQEAVQKFLQARRRGYMDERMWNFVQTQPDILRQLGPQFQQQVMMAKFQAQSSIRALTTMPNQSDTDLNVAKAAESLIQLDSVAERVGQEGSYFPYAQGKTNESRLEFDLWLRKADKLGITIRPSDAPAFVQEEFNNQIKPEVWTAVEKTFQTKQGFNRSRLESALADEFRVKTAFDIVMGKVRPVVTPYETFQVFKEKSDPALYTIMAVPAENFLDKVTGTPTDAELRDLFDKYKAGEPDPTRETPGFRDPRKLKIAWLEVKGDEPVFKQRGEEAYKLNDLGVRLAALGFGPTGTLIAPLTLTLADPQLQAAYAGYRVKFEDSIRDNWSPTRREDDRLLDTSVVRPQVVAAAVGSTFGSLLTRGSFLTPLMSIRERALQNERNDRARGLAMLLAPGSTAGTGVVGNTIAAGVSLPKPLPLDVVRTELVDAVKKSVTLGAAQADVQAFATEMSRLGAKKDKSEARSYADKYMAERGLKHGGSTDFRDQYAIDEDPGLSVLADKLDRGHRMNDIPLKFGPAFFQGRDPRGVPTLSYFDPQVYPDQGPGSQVTLREFEPTYLTWRTDSVEPSTPREFAAAKPKVEAAWKRMKARELAKQSAEELKKRIDDRLKEENAMGQKGKVQQIVNSTYHTFQQEKYSTDPEKQGRSPLFLVDKVAPFRIDAGSPFDVQNRGEQLVGFQLNHLTKRQLPNPSVKMARDLVESKDKPQGTTLLETDKANDIYYVAALVERDDSPLPYFEAKGIVEGQSQVASTVLRIAELDAARKIHENVVALLKTEFRVANESEKLKEKPTAE